MKSRFILQLVLLCMSASISMGQSKDLDALNSTGTEAARSALRRLLNLARNGKPEEQLMLRDQLKSRLCVTSDPVVMEQIATALAPICDDECLSVVSGRIPLTRHDPTSIMLCRSAQLLLTSGSPLSPDARKHTSDQLQVLAQDETRETCVTEAACVALAATGSDGFDRLTSLYGQKRSAGLTQIYFTALAETGEVRAIPLLISALKDGRENEGQQTQIVRSLGVLFRSILEKRVLLADSVRRDSIELLHTILTGQSSDQLYETALQSLAIIDGSDPLLQTGIRAALSSAAPSRREAALQAIYQVNVPQESALIEYIAAMSQSDPDESVKAAAVAVVDKARTPRE